MAQCLYSPSQTIIRSNFTYACSGNAGGVVTLRNQNNTIINTPQAMKDGTRFTGTDDGVPAPYTTSLKVINIYNIITSCLTQSDINKVKGEVMLLSMYINSDTGIIMEIEFDITLFDNKWCRIEPEKYYAIEQALKSNITFNITEQGKKYTYNLCWIPVKFK
ncbi:MAG: DUF5043 domain-containing protein [Paludibacter sp.]|nr:DUF5043 domain-containing protein [Paludibacter sp.]